MSSPPKKIITLFGSTGGTGLSILRNCLASHHTVHTLVRNPSTNIALQSLLLQYPGTLHIHTGDIYSLPSIKEYLVHEGKIVDVIISAIGMTAYMKGLTIVWPTKTLCFDATNNILTSLKTLEVEGYTRRNGEGRGPKIVLLSTTGISDKGRDIPVAMVPFYHWMLQVPHKDKKRMEDVMAKGMGKERDWVVVRPSFFWGEGVRGRGSVRVGVEGFEGEVGEKGNGGEWRPEIGYTISREEVGGWVFRECVEGEGKEWAGKCVSLTY